MTAIARSALLEVPVSCAYDVVLDVGSYPEFLPGCRAVDILELTPSGLVARVSVAGKGLSESFTTRNEHRANESVQMTLIEGPFEQLQGHWQFTALGDLGCRVDVSVDFVARGLIARMLGSLAGSVADRIVDAFSQRITARASNPAGGQLGQ